MGFVVGALLFAVGIALTIALHEAGHMGVALACGMRVRRYFIGFGPTVFSFTRGHTTYGLKAIPMGGFCDIAGMTAQDELTEDERPLAMWKKPVWQRIAVLAGGISVNLIVGFVVLLVVAMTSGLPDSHADVTATVASTSCPSPKQTSADTFEPCSGPSPAEQAGIVAGDKITAIDGQSVASFVELARDIRTHPGETVTLTVLRDGSTLEVPVHVAPVERLVKDTDGTIHTATVGAIGVSSAPLKLWKTFTPAEAVPATVRFAGSMLGSTVTGLAEFPAKIPGVAKSIVGGARDESSPMSVVGATRVGGELAARSQWSIFAMMLASLNFFLALFNVVPLPPLDGGHIAVVVWEKIRDFFRRLRGLAPAGPADYTKLMPLTYAVSAVLLVVGLIVIVADVVNPITLG